ncbi:MAG: hypothetical protein V3V61_07610 [Gammaproteobacteria bacterium]
MAQEQKQEREFLSPDDCRRKALEEFHSLEVPRTPTIGGSTSLYATAEAVADLVSLRNPLSGTMRGFFQIYILGMQKTMKSTEGTDRQSTNEELEEIFSRMQRDIKRDLAGRGSTRGHRAFLQCALLITERCLTWLIGQDPGTRPELPGVRSYLEPHSYFADGFFSHNSPISNGYTAADQEADQEAHRPYARR